MKPEKNIGKTIKRALRLDRALLLVWRSAPGWTLVNSAMIVIQGLLPLAALYLMKRTVDAVSFGIVSAEKTTAFHEVLFWILLTGIVALLIALSRSVSELASEAQSQKVTDSVSDIIHSQSIAVDLAYYEDPRYYDTLHLAQQQAPYRPARIVNGLVQIGQNGIALAGIIILLISFDWRIALLLFAAALPGAIVRLVYARKLYDLELKQTESERRASYYHWILTDTSHAKEIRLLDSGKYFKARFCDIRKELGDRKLSLSTRRSLIDLAAQLFSIVAVFSTFVFICYRALDGSITLGSLIMYYMAFQSGLSFLQGILKGVAGLYEDNLFLSGFYEFLDLKPAIERLPDSQKIPADPKKGIAFHYVNFAYPGSARAVLKDINLQIAPGQVIAVVGENGSGKTTLVKLLCRLYDPEDGHIELEGTDLRNFDPIDWRKQISVVFQDYVHYALNVRENIRVGDIDRAPEDDSIISAAKLSGADPFIRNLPLGYETILSHGFKGGQELSTGEWQKIVLARAFLRDSRLVILDEPSSSLDPLAEAELFSKFRNIIEGRSAILISHRFSTVKMADYIYVMDSGRIVEQGSHDELMNKNGRYSCMYRAAQL